MIFPEMEVQIDSSTSWEVFQYLEKFLLANQRIQNDLNSWTYYILSSYNSMWIQYFIKQ